MNKHFNSSPFIGWHKFFQTSNEVQSPSPIAAYSEFMPGPKLGYTSYGSVDQTLFAEEDPFGWAISELEETYQLKPGLRRIGGFLMKHILDLGRDGTDTHIGEHRQQNLTGNPYWPPELASQVHVLHQERFVCIVPLALSITQDDKGRLRWTLFGGSQAGPETVFWKAFFSSPGKELPAERFYEFISTLLANAYGVKFPDPRDLLKNGFRILPAAGDRASSIYPSWAKEFFIHKENDFLNIRYLLTFVPFQDLPEGVKRGYLAGKINLLPFPGSLVFWGMPTYHKLQNELPLAGQIPLLRLIPRHGGPDGIRVPQSGWIREPGLRTEVGEFNSELLLHEYARTNRWDRVHRHEDEVTENPRIQKVVKVLFSTDLDVMGLYDKPMARNCQIWNRDYELVLNGPEAAKAELIQAKEIIESGGTFGYRFLFPPARIGQYDLFWHRLLVTYISTSGEVQFHPDPPLGYMTGSSTDPEGHTDMVELWPRILNRPAYCAALSNFNNSNDEYTHQTPINLVSLMDVWQLLGKKSLPTSFIRHLLRIPKRMTLEEWTQKLAEVGAEPQTSVKMQELIRSISADPVDPGSTLNPITFMRTAGRSFEVAYWNDIRLLAEGEFRNKDNADCVLDSPTENDDRCVKRDLDLLGDYLITRHREAIHQAGMDGQAFCGELPFHWTTDFDFPRFGGWKLNQDHELHERDILVVIPGNDHTHCVVLADHYDTAYMEDIYDRSRGGTGARSSAAGADDNYSATATLLQAAPIFLDLAKKGRLEIDIWLLHLTGEEFPADCLGARHFCQMLIEKKLILSLPENNKKVDLNGTRIQGIFLMDMIAHNRDDYKDTFQISPGSGERSIRLALKAHTVNMNWNANTSQWNNLPERKNATPAKRSFDGKTIPDLAPFLPLFGEVRPKEDYRSCLYNTDGQIFSDAGIPVVLFMEDYDINRSGYHDSKDNMQNIDLDYGAALSAIAIETCAQIATERPES